MGGQERLRAAVVGCGGAGVYNHIAWYATHPGVELVAVVDADPQRAAGVAAQWRGRPYHDLGTMLERERPRLVSIATPVHLHADHTIQCLQAGCDVLCEKPMAPRPADCRRMLDGAAASGRMLGIALDKRFSEEFRRARELIQGGEIGEPLFVRIHWVATVEWSGFRTKRYTGGGVFQDVGSHFLDLIPWTLDTELRSVQGSMQLFHPERLEVEDHAVATLHTASGLQALVETSWIGPFDYNGHIEEFWVYGRTGTVKAFGNLRFEAAGAAFAGATTESAASSSGGQPGDLLEARGPMTAEGVYYIDQYSTIADYRAATGNDITSFGESPMLTARVEAGKLPPVEERLPDEPYVVVPLDNVGKYGGTFRLVGTGVGEAQHSINAGLYGNLLYRQGSANGTILPYIATSWSNSPDFRTYTFSIRRGVNWSDGSPFTVDDILFWWNDIQLNQDLSPGGPPPQLTSGGEPATFRKIDDHTLQIAFAGPNTLVINYFSGGAELYPWRPAQYLKQFHQNYADAETLSGMIKDGSFELWNQLFQFHGDGNAWKVDPNVPTLRPWVRTTTVDQAIIWERNPYYWKIDTAGNQLPYMDRSFVDVVSDVEVYKAKAQSGEIDRGDRGLGAKDLALYVANASANNYQVGLIRQFAAGSPGIFFNMNYPHSEGLRTLFRAKDFRVAMSLAMNRDEINDAFFLGRAHPRQPAPLATDPYYDSDWENAYTVQDVDEANRLLDGLGLTRGADGFRTYPDGSAIETLEITSGNWFAPWGSVMEMVSIQWEEVGIRAQVNNVAGGGPFVEKASSNELMVSAPSAWYTQLGPWIGAPEVLLAYNWGNGVVHNWGPLWAKWYVSKGEEGEEPPAEVKRIYELWDAMSVAPNEEERDRLAREIVNIHKENLFFIGTVGDWVYPFITHKRIKNVPSNMQTEYYVPEQWYIDE